MAINEPITWSQMWHQLAIEAANLTPPDVDTATQNVVHANNSHSSRMRSESPFLFDSWNDSNQTNTSTLASHVNAQAMTSEVLSSPAVDTHVNSEDMHITEMCKCCV